MRERIRVEVASIQPIDDKERTTQIQVLDWIDSGNVLCRTEKPATPKKHLVSYFVVIDGDYVLLVDHINAQLWLPTGGHVEPDEHPRETVLREAKEELGLSAEFLLDQPIFLTSTETVGKTSGHTDVSIWYAIKGDRTRGYQVDRSEFKAIRWFHKEDIPVDKTDPEMSRFVKKLYFSEA